MNSSTNLSTGIQGLLADTAGTVIEVAKVAYLNAANQEVKAFYCHLGYNCFRLQVSLARARQESIEIDKHYVDQAISSLGLLIPETCLQEHPANLVTHDFRLESINRLWENIRTGSESLKAEFVQRWLSQDLTEEQRNVIDKTLERSADVFETSQPEQPLRKSATTLEALRTMEPELAIGTAANSVFNAMIACKDCSCHPQHDFKAKLELGTYRTPEKKAACQKPVRRNPTDEDLDAIEMGMFLSMERGWHEFRVQTVKQRVVRFKDAAETMPHKRKRGRMMKIETLCSPIVKTRERPLQRLLLRLESGQLFEVQHEKSTFQIDNSTKPVSLFRCLEDKRDLFTEKTKRILFLILGYTVLHLCSTSWLQSSWGSSSIKFFQTMACKTPLRPFIEVHLQKEDTCERSDNDAKLIDDLNSGHCCPELIALAVLLMEIYFVRPFSQLASMHNISLIPTESGCITLVDVDQVFGGVEDSEEGWRAQIPEDSPILEIIDNCLDVTLWGDIEGEPLSAEELRSRIYKKVVWPLELYLTQGFSQIHLDTVDEYAKNLDFGQWGQEITGSEADNQSISLSSALTRNGSIPPSIPLVQTLPISTEFQNSRQLLSQLPPVILYKPSAASLEPVSDAFYGAPQFSDNQSEVSVTGRDQYRAWRAEYRDVYKIFLGDFLKGLPSEPVRVAILDTGIDSDHPMLEAREDRLGGQKDFYNSTQRVASDTRGHGTFAASLLLDYAPDVSLYIAKIADKKNMTPNVEHVVDVSSNPPYLLVEY
ncbi:major intracellular serine protease [Fusarium coicis]|nr:major intracellular serine protease [Fusarium coicis]